MSRRKTAASRTVQLTSCHITGLLAACAHPRTYPHVCGSISGRSAAAACPASKERLTSLKSTSPTSSNPRPTSYNSLRSATAIEIRLGQIQRLLVIHKRGASAETAAAPFGNRRLSSCEPAENPFRHFDRS